MKPYLSAGVVVVRNSPEQRLYLLLRAYNYWDFPKGKVEADETPLDAAIREVQEESGLRDLHFDWGEVFIETRPYGRPLKIARYYLARTATERITLDVNPELGRPEHHEYRWVTAEQARRLLSPRVRLVLEWAEGILNNA